MNLKEILEPSKWNITITTILFFSMTALNLFFIYIEDKYAMAFCKAIGCGIKNTTFVSFWSSISMDKLFQIISSNGIPLSLTISMIIIPTTYYLIHSFISYKLKNK